MGRSPASQRSPSSALIKLAMCVQPFRPQGMRGSALRSSRCTEPRWPRLPPACSAAGLSTTRGPTCVGGSGGAGAGREAMEAGGKGWQAQAYPSHKSLGPPGNPAYYASCPLRSCPFYKKHSQVSVCSFPPTRVCATFAPTFPCYRSCSLNHPPACPPTCLPTHPPLDTCRHPNPPVHPPTHPDVCCAGGSIVECVAPELALKPCKARQARAAHARLAHGAPRLQAGLLTLTQQAQCRAAPGRMQPCAMLLEA